VELEQRIKTLEYEIKILKNEIQRTLLDIHEQVLIHYYPSLRIEETQPPASVVQAVEAARSKQPSPPETPSAKQTSDETSAKPAVRKVSLGQVRSERNESSTPKPAENQQNKLPMKRPPNRRLEKFRWAKSVVNATNHRRPSRQRISKGLS